MSADADVRITIVRLCRAPRDLVWKVWTDQRHVAAWWGPFGRDRTTTEIDVRVGGVYYVGMQAPDGSEHPSRGVIRELKPFEKIVIAGDPQALDACGVGLPPGALVTVLFEDAGAHTRITLDARFETKAEREVAEKSGFLTSWTATFDVLDAYFRQPVDLTTTILYS